MFCKVYGKVGILGWIGVGYGVNWIVVYVCIVDVIEIGCIFIVLYG